MEQKSAKNNVVDEMSNAVGELGRWQLFIFLMASVPAKMTAMWHQLGIIFLAPKTIYWCVERQNTSETVENSTCYKDCVKYEYFSEFDSTIISEWELICDRAWLANFNQTVCMFGVLVGSIVYGYIADRYGRRRAMLLASILQLCCSMILPFSPDYWTFTIIRFLIGTSTAGVMVISFVIVLEIIGPGKRDIMTSLYQLPSGFGEMVLPAFSYFLKSWNMFSIGIGIPHFLFLSYIFILPESPKWLISMGRLKEAVDVMKNGAKFNKLPTENIQQIAENIYKEINANKNTDVNKKPSYLDLIRIPSLRTNNICSCVCWFILGLSFYGGNQYIGQTSSNTYVTIVLAGALQIPGIVLSGVFYKRFGRKRTVIGFCLTCAVSNGLLVLPDHLFYVKLLAGAIAISSAAGAFTTMYTFTCELFPTVVRNMAVGASSTASRIGSMLAPFVAGLNGAAWIPPTVFAIAPVIAVIASCYLEETKGKKLTDHLPEC